MELVLNPKMEDGQLTVLDLDQQLLLAESELKKYNYVVTENNYKDAKKDRADLNKLVKQVSDARKGFEDKAYGQWKKDKAKIMDFEKTVKSYADNLAEGMNVFDEKEKEEKRNSIMEMWDSLLEERSSEYYDLLPMFNEKWLNKTYSSKQIEDDLKSIYEKIKQDLGFLETFLPEDKVEAEQVRSKYFEHYDLTEAKMLADDIKRLRERVEAKPQEQVNVQETLKNVTTQPQTSDTSGSVNTNWAEFRVEGTREDLIELTKALQALKAKTNFTYKVTGKGEL